MKALLSDVGTLGKGCPPSGLGLGRPGLGLKMSPGLCPSQEPSGSASEPGALQVSEASPAAPWSWREAAWAGTGFFSPWGGHFWGFEGLATVNIHWLRLSL